MSGFDLLTPTRVDGQLAGPDGPFPLVLAPLVLAASSPPSLEQALAWIVERRESLLAQVGSVGAVLFRGLPLNSADHFDAFIRAFELPNFPYEQSLSNAVRVNKTERVFTANEAPSEVTIFLHHEMAQTPIFPSKLFFFCEQAADAGGATPLCRSDLLFTKIEQELPQFAADCREKGLRYRAVMPATNDPNSGMGRSWQHTFRAESINEAEARMRELGYEWQWREDGSLETTTPVLPAVKKLKDGRETFFNQLIAAFRGWKDERNDPGKSITFGDGQPLPADDVLRACELADLVTFDVPWCSGDVALVDNLVAMHGRRPFEGARRVLASLVA